MNGNKDDSTTPSSSDADQSHNHQEEATSSHTHWNKHDRMYECTGCGYFSERKSNVARHYHRIHSDLKKPKICACSQVFKTKGEYYEHCYRVHPNLRHSFMTSEKYKIGKPKTARVEPIEECDHEPIKLARRGVRSSTRLQSLYEKTACNGQEIVINDVPDSCNPEELLNYFNDANDVDQVQCVKSPEASNKSEKSNSDDEAGKNGGIDLEALEEFIAENVLESIDEENVPAKIEYCFYLKQDETVCSTDSTMGNLDTAHLPPKKRFGSFTKRKGLSDVTNIVNNRSNEQTFVKRIKNNNDENFNRNLMHASNHNFTKVNEEHRAYISQIDFDELDAILNLKYLQNPDH